MKIKTVFIKAVCTFSAAFVIAVLLAMKYYVAPSGFVMFFFSSSSIIFILTGIRVYTDLCSKPNDSASTYFKDSIGIEAKHALAGLCCSFIAISMIIPQCYDLLARINIAPTEYMTIYEEDNVFSPEEMITIPEGTFYLRETNDDKFEVVTKDNATGEYISGPIETSMGKPDTLGECIDLQVECWLDDYKNRKVYYREVKAK